MAMRGRRATVGATIGLLLAVNAVVVGVRAGDRRAGIPIASAGDTGASSAALGLTGLATQQEPGVTLPAPSPGSPGPSTTVQAPSKGGSSTTARPATAPSSSTSTTAVAAVSVGISGPGLYVVNADGTQPRKLVGSLGQFSWSPDGTRLAYGDGGDLIVVRADGTGRTTLPAQGALSPAWSPDGSRISYARSGGGVYVVRGDGSRPATLVDPHAHLTAWTPDGRIVVITTPLSGFSSVVIYDDAGGRRVIAADANTIVQPAPSPDGRLVAYMSNRVLVAGIDGSGSRPLTEMCCGSESVGSPLRWSPDSRLVAFIDQGDVKVVGSDGSRERVLVPRATSPDWSPDGRRLAVADQQRTRADGLIHMTLGVVDADGSNRRTVLDAGQKLSVHEPQWSPNGRQLAAVVAGPFALPR